MKKFIIGLLLLCVASFCFADTVYEIDTKYGKEQVIIPDGYTEKDVLLIIAKNYYELNYEHTELEESVEKLNTTIETYIEQNKDLRDKYSNLIIKYDDLVKEIESYGKWSNFQGFVGGSFTYDFKDTYGFGVTAGMFLFNKTLISISVNSPFTVGVSVGFVI